MSMNLLFWLRGKGTKLCTFLILLRGWCAKSSRIPECATDENDEMLLEPSRISARVFWIVDMWPFSLKEILIKMPCNLLHISHICMWFAMDRCYPILPSRIEQNWQIHPGRLTWNIIIGVWKIIFLSKWVICRFHVNLPGCTQYVLRS